MSMKEAISAYNCSPFGIGEPVMCGGGKYSVGQSHGTTFIWLNCSSPAPVASGGGDKDNCAKVMLVFAAIVAAFSTIVFACLSADSFNSSAKYAEGKELANDERPAAVVDIRRVFGGLQAERTLTGFSHLLSSAASALFVAACVFAILKRGPYVKCGIAGGASAGGALVFFLARYSANPKAAYDRLVKGNYSLTPTAPPAPPEGISADGPPPYSEH